MTTPAISPKASPMDERTGNHAPLPQRAPPRLAICAGVFSSGSTWLFNVVGRLFRLADPQGTGMIHSEDLDATVESALLTHRHLVIKTHTPSQALRATAAAGAPTIVTVRDPRDAAASLVQRFGHDPDAAARWVQDSSTTIGSLLDQPGLLVLRYESGFTHTPDTIDLVATHLGIAISVEQRDAIFAALTPQKVKETIGELEREGVLQPASPDIFDPQTQWHSAHVGDLRNGKWRDVFTPPQAARILFLSQPLPHLFGYPEASELALASGCRLVFGQNGEGLAYLGTGFSVPEAWGIWTAADAAELRLPLQGALGDTLVLEFQCLLSPVLRSGFGDAGATVTVNGRPVGLVRTGGLDAEHLMFAVHQDLRQSERGNEIAIRFDFANLVSPADAGLSADARLIGLGLIGLRIEYDDMALRGSARPADT